MSAFLAIAMDVPRRLARGWVIWIFVVIIALLVGVFAGALGRGEDAKGAFLTFFGSDTRDPSMPAGSIEGNLATYLGGLFGQAIACYFGVFAGLVFLADAVSSAFAPGQAELNVPKPLHRATIVLARHAGAALCALFFATLLVGGAVLVAFLRTGVLVPRVLLYIPGSLVLFVLLHAIGTIAAVGMGNAFFGAFLAATAWAASILTKAPEWFALDKSLSVVIQEVAHVARITHRVIPRVQEVPTFISRVIEHKPLDPLWKPEDIELSANVLVWWGLALVIAIVLIRRRDF